MSCLCSNFLCPCGHSPALYFASYPPWCLWERTEQTVATTEEGITTLRWLLSCSTQHAIHPLGNGPFPLRQAGGSVPSDQEAARTLLLVIQQCRHRALPSISCGFLLPTLREANTRVRVMTGHTGPHPERLLVLLGC